MTDLSLLSFLFFLLSSEYAYIKRVEVFPSRPLGFKKKFLFKARNVT